MGVVPSDHWPQGFKIPPGALGTIPESARPVQVQKKVARKSVILVQFTGLALSGMVPSAPGGKFYPCNKRSEGGLAQPYSLNIRPSSYDLVHDEDPQVDEHDDQEEPDEGVVQLRSFPLPHRLLQLLALPLQGHRLGERLAHQPPVDHQAGGHRHALPLLGGGWQAGQVTR